MSRPVQADAEAARAICARLNLSDVERVALAAELVRDITSTSCRMPLRRLITLADATAHELGRVALARGDIV